MATFYWVGGTGNTNDSAHWSSSSGGAGGAGTPGTSDTAIVDNNSGTNPIITSAALLDVNTLIVGDSTKKTPQPVKDITLNFEPFGMRASVAITLYGNVQTKGSNVFAMTGGTLKSFTDSLIMGLQAGQSGTGSASPTVTFDDGTSDGTRTYYNLGSLSVVTRANAGSSITVVFPSTTPQGTTVTIASFNYAVAASKNYIFNFSSNSRITITGVYNYTSSGSPTSHGATNMGTSQLILDGTVYFNALQTIQWNIIKLATGATVTFLPSITANSFIIGDRSTLIMGATITASFILGTDVTTRSTTPGIRGNFVTAQQLVAHGWNITDLAVYGNGVLGVGYMNVLGGVDGGNNLHVNFQEQSGSSRKTYVYKIYNAPKLADIQLWKTFDNEAVLLGYWTDVEGDPQFSNEINTAGPSMTVRRIVDPTNFGEATNFDPGTVGYRYHVEVYCISDYAVNGECIFKGFISQWTPHDEQGSRYVDITLLSYGSELSQVYATNDFTSGGNTSVAVGSVGIGALLTIPAGTYRAAMRFLTPGGSQVITAMLAAGAAWANTYQVTLYIVNESASAPNMASVVWQKTIDVIPLRDAAGKWITYLPISVTLSGATGYWFVWEASADAFGGSPAKTVVGSKINTSGGTANAHAAYWDGAAWQQNNSWAIYEFALYKDFGSTTIVYSGANWKTSLESLLTDYTSGKAGHINWSVTADPSITFTHTFVSQTYDQIIQFFVDMAPVGWYWYVDPSNNTIYIKPPPGTPTHYFRFGKDLQSYELQSTMEGVVNQLYLTGGDTGGGVNLFRLYINTASVARYGLRSTNYSDNTLTNTATADLIGTAILNGYKLPTLRAPVNIGGTGGGYHIEVIKPGDKFSILNTANNTQVASLTASRVDYNADTAAVSASTAPPQINNTVESIQRGLESEQGLDNPSAPTVVEVL